MLWEVPAGIKQALKSATNWYESFDLLLCAGADGEKVELLVPFCRGLAPAFIRQLCPPQQLHKIVDNPVFKAEHETSRFCEDRCLGIYHTQLSFQAVPARFRYLLVHRPAVTRPCSLLFLIISRIRYRDGNISCRSRSYLPLYSSVPALLPSLRHKSRQRSHVPRSLHICSVLSGWLFRHGKMMLSVAAAFCSQAA